MAGAICVSVSACGSSSKSVSTTAVRTTSTTTNASMTTVAASGTAAADTSSPTTGASGTGASTATQSGSVPETGAYPSPGATTGSTPGTAAPTTAAPVVTDAPTTTVAPALAPSGLIIAKLASSIDLATATGGAVSAVQDDGGQDLGGYGFGSKAELNTANAKLTLHLSTYISADNATQAFVQAASKDPTKAIAGLGDQAALSISGTGIVVRTGAQLLAIDGAISDAAEQVLETGKENNTLDQATFDAINGAPLNDSKAAATAIVAKLDGRPVTGVLAYLPLDAVDPCTIDTASLAQGSITVSKMAVESDRPPASQCLYTFISSTADQSGTGTIAVDTLSSTQASAAITPTTPTKVFHQQVAAMTANGEQPDTLADGPVTIAAATLGQFDTVMLIALDPAPAGFVARPKDEPPLGPDEVIIEMRRQFNGDRLAEDCKAEMFKLFKSILHDNHVISQMDVMVPGTASRAIDDYARKIREWCSEFKYES